MIYFGQSRPSAISCDQPSSDEEPVAKCKMRENLCTVLGQSEITGLHAIELPLDHPERVLDLGPQFGNEAVDPALERMQLAADRGLAHDAPKLSYSPIVGQIPG